jgi:hypothetical protein
VRGRPPDHPPRIRTHRYDPPRQFVDRDNRRLENNDSVAAAEHDRIRGAKINSQRPRTTTPHNQTPPIQLDRSRCAYRERAIRHNTMRLRSTGRNTGW